MLNSPILKANPNINVFLPILYLVWSDAVLTPTEVTALNALIDKQGWLTNEEINFLKSQLNPQHPPSPDEFKNWLKEIRSAAEGIAPEAHVRLVDIGIRLAELKGDGSLSPALAKARESLLQVEETLGLIGGEALYSFYPEKRHTITEEGHTEKTFDIEAMARLLDGDQAAIIQKVKTIISDKQFAYHNIEVLGPYREKVLTWCKLLADQGFGAMAFPKEHGGGGDMAAYFAIMEAISHHDLSLVIKFGVQFGLWGMSVYFLGTEKHHKKYLKDIGSLELPGGFAMTETGHGSNVKGIETTATYDHATRAFVIHTPNERAKKEFIGNTAAHGQMATVFAKLIVEGKDYGVSAIVVPLRDKNGKFAPGVTIEDCGPKLGLNGVDNGKIQFTNVRVPYDNLLDKFCSVTPDGKFDSPIASDNRRFFTMLGTLVGGRIGIPRSGNTAAKSGLTIAIRYGDKRPQFGPEGGTEVPILNYRMHQRRLIPYLATVYACHFALRYLTDRFLKRSEKDMQEIEALAAGLKSFTTWNASACLQECREACGGKGYLSENRIDRLRADSDIYTTFEGDNTVLMQLTAKSRLSEFKQEFGNMNLFGVLNYVADKAATSITEKNPFITRSTDENHLLDFEFHMNAFEYREREILTSSAQRLRKLISGGMDSFDAFNVSQHQLIDVAVAHIERVILEQFIKQIEHTKDAGCKAVLTKLCQLFALSLMEEHKGWYLESGYMEAPKTKAIRKLVSQLCWDIRQEAVPLVDAFKIPENCLSAPIARRG